MRDAVVTRRAAAIRMAAGGEVIGQGTVLQIDDAPPQFCLGGVRESYPPQVARSGATPVSEN